MVRRYVLIVWCCVIGVACAKFSSHNQLLRPTNRSILLHSHSKVKKPTVAHHLLTAKKSTSPKAHLVNTKHKRPTVAHHLVSARKTAVAHRHVTTHSKQKRNNNDEQPKRLMIIITRKRPRQKQEGHKMSAKSKKLRSRFVKAKAPATRSHLVKAKQSTIRSHFVKAKTPTIRRHFVKAKTPTIRRHFVKAEQPTIRSHFVKAEQPTIRSHFVKAKKSQTDNHVVKTNKSPMKNKMSLARLKRLRHARPILAGHGGRKQLMGGSMYPEEEEGHRGPLRKGLKFMDEVDSGQKYNGQNDALGGQIHESTKLNEDKEYRAEVPTRF